MFVCEAVGVCVCVCAYVCVCARVCVSVRVRRSDPCAEAIRHIYIYSHIYCGGGVRFFLVVFESKMRV